MKIRRFILLAVLALSLAACDADRKTETKIADAEAVSASGKYADAVEMCSDIINSSDSASLTATQWCRMGMIYASASENDLDNETNMGIAAHCFDRAYAQNADSVSAFVEKLSPGEHSTVSVVLMLLKMKGVDASNVIDPEDCDSLVISEYAEP